MKVPFADLKAQHAPIRGEIRRAIDAVVDSGEFSLGQFVEEFEHKFASYCKVNYAVAVGSGTDALLLSLLALGVGSGDEVITVPMTYVATAEAISMTGAKPVFVDIDQSTYTMNPHLLKDTISSKTKAIIPVHLFGHPADMESIMEIAEKYRIPVIEDASQAHGTLYRGRKTGSLGHIGCFSFYPSKNLGALGEAGAIVTNDRKVTEKLRCLRNHGQLTKNQHCLIGWNSRMDNIQAAVLTVKLKYLDQNNALRRDIAIQYGNTLKSFANLVTPIEANDAVHSYHIYAIQVPDRKKFVDMLNGRCIGHAIHYPIPIHLQKAYSHLGYRIGDFIVSEKCSKRFVSLPVFPELSNQQITIVIESLRDCLI